MPPPPAVADSDFPVSDSNVRSASAEAGLEFFLASNGVLLCEGPVPLAHVQLIQEGDLPEEWRAARKLNQGRANGKERSGGKRRGVR